MESDEAAAAASPQASGGTVTPAPKKRGRKPKTKDDSQTPSSNQQSGSSGGKMKESGKKTQQLSVDEKYTQWKGLVPILYDWLANHNLVWPSLSCRFSRVPLPLSSRVSVVNRGVNFFSWVISCVKSCKLSHVWIEL